ncbi:hypothetical protein DFQ03_1275 [Maribacter caenipelagi]|uniref:Uncharacterized protein n=1 Tax=Maribacter caenipelagi TaxID=1447781 RepID=A0A4R7D6L3_9FLAO|nr:hypothetical protein DFQ03_1275 [Maribacter caenipelagi]
MFMEKNTESNCYKRVRLEIVFHNSLNLAAEYIWSNQIACYCYLNLNFNYINTEK